MVTISLEYPEVLQDALEPGGPGLSLVTSLEDLSAEDRATKARIAIGMLVHAEAILGSLTEETIGDVIADDSLSPATRDILLSPSRLSSEVRERMVAKVHGIDTTETTAETAETSGEPLAEKAARLSRGELTPAERARATAILDATYQRAGKIAIAA